MERHAGFVLTQLAKVSVIMKLRLMPMIDAHDCILVYIAV